MERSSINVNAQAVFVAYLSDFLQRCPRFRNTTVFFFFFSENHELYYPISFLSLASFNHSQ